MSPAGIWEKKKKEEKVLSKTQRHLVGLVWCTVIAALHTGLCVCVEQIDDKVFWI